MKLLIICALVAFAAAAEWTPKSWEEMKQIRYKCLDDSKMSEDLKSRIRNHEAPKDEKVMQYMGCFFRGAELFDEKEGIRKDRFVRLWKDRVTIGELNDAMAKCFDNNDEKTSEDEWMWRNWKCISNTNLQSVFRDQIKW